MARRLPSCSSGILSTPMAKRLALILLTMTTCTLLFLSLQYPESRLVSAPLPYEHPPPPEEVMPSLESNEPPPPPSETVEVHEAPVALGEGTANATMLVLCRNSDLEGILSSMESVERRFNKNYGYPWTFLNNEEFTDEFKQRVSDATNSAVQFGVVPQEHWAQPDWIDEKVAAAYRMRLRLLNVPYGDQVPYRNMCRYNSGYFYRHPLVQSYRYYWRVEPDIKYHCDITYDPFVFMEKNDKVYGFTITLTEFDKTIPSLWTHTKEFTEQHPEYLPANNAINYLSNDGGDTYNLCHFWSNFEIADMDFWRSEAYTEYFEYLESKGGFYYERWGDAPVHSIGAALFADRNRLHFFDDIGYEHSPFEHCPSGKAHSEGNCECKKGAAINSVRRMCLSKFKKLFK